MNEQEYFIDEMRAEAGDYPRVSPTTRAIAAWLNKRPLAIPEPQLTEMDKAVLRQNGGL